jgi:hypothetical protein
MTTLDEALDLVAQLSSEEQDMLVRIVQHRRREQWRSELAQNAEESLAAFHRGELKPETAEEAIASLRQHLAQVVHDEQNDNVEYQNTLEELHEA